MANLVSSTLTGNLTVTANVSAANYTGNGAALTGIASFDSGTKMVFYQASAPTGWTQDTASALSNTVMAVVTGTGGGTVGGHTLSTPEIASHVHNVRLTPGNPFSGQIRQGGGQDFGNKNTDSAGGGGSHSHPFSGSLSSATADVSVTVPAANVKYANVIVATKD
jgi:hypothetical protein